MNGKFGDGIMMTSVLTTLTLVSLILMSQVLVLAASKDSFAAGFCDEQSKKILDLRKQHAGKQTGGIGYDPNTKEPLVEQMKEHMQKAKSHGCSPPAAMRSKTDNIITGTKRDTEYVPLAPGEGGIPEDRKSFGNLVTPFKSGRKIPVPPILANPPPFSSPFKPTPPPFFPTPDAPENCGELASAYLDERRRQGGTKKPIYKDDCAGVDEQGIPRVSPNKPGTACEVNNFGPFGVVYAGYNNSVVTQNVDFIAQRSPSSFSAIDSRVIAHNNTSTGTKKIVDGCNITNLQKCGVQGDIVLLKTDRNASDSTPYNHWLVYAGNNQFFEAQNVASNVIKKGSLQGSYANMTYEIFRLPCAVEKKDP